MTEIYCGQVRKCIKDERRKTTRSNQGDLNVGVTKHNTSLVGITTRKNRTRALVFEEEKKKRERESWVDVQLFLFLAIITTYKNINKRKKITFLFLTFSPIFLSSRRNTDQSELFLPPPFLSTVGWSKVKKYKKTTKRVYYANISCCVDNGGPTRKSEGSKKCSCYPSFSAVH